MSLKIMGKNNNKLKMNKRADIPITLLVVMTLVLSSMTLYSFSVNQGSVNEKIVDPAVLDSLYYKEVSLNLYTNEIIESSLREINLESGSNLFNEQVFKNKFQEKLDAYKNSKGEFIVTDFNELAEKSKNMVIIQNNENGKEVINVKISGVKVNLTPFVGETKEEKAKQAKQPFKGAEYIFDFEKTYDLETFKNKK